MESLPLQACACILCVSRFRLEAGGEVGVLNNQGGSGDIKQFECYTHREQLQYIYDGHLVLTTYTVKCEL